MSWLGNLFFGEKENRAILVNLPSPIVYALETIVYLQNTSVIEENKTTRDDVIVTALNQYLSKNLWTTKEEENAVKINRSKINTEEIYTTGRKQARG